MPSAEHELFILGAGCSVTSGYPTAAAMVPGLASFGETLGGEAEKVRGCVERTVTLMRKLKVPTIDELAHRLHHGRGDDLGTSSVEATRQRYTRIAEAKIATSAYFESLERSAADTGLRPYHDFLHRLFPSSLGRHYQDQLRRSKAHVFSFNYDRLFEIAFSQHFKVDANMAFYGEGGLNSGVNAFHNENLSFRDDRFSLLKLHGSVGMFAHDDVFGLQIMHSTPSADGSEGIKDESYFYQKSGELPKPMWSLMFFPHEKEYLLSDQETAFPYRNYAKQVWQRAEALAAAATEIWIIGYSMCETDFPYTLKFLRAAKDCERIVVQGPHPTAIIES